MTTTEEIIIPLSKLKLTLLLVGSFVFVLFGLWFVIAPPETNHPFFGNTVLIFGAGIAAIIFFGLTTILGIKKLTDTKPGLIIGKEGITKEYATKPIKN